MSLLSENFQRTLTPPNKGVIQGRARNLRHRGFLTGEAEESLKIVVRRDFRVFNRSREHVIQQEDGGIQEE